MARLGASDWSELSGPVREVLEWAAAGEPSGTVGSRGVLIGIIRAREGDNEADQLLKYFGVSRVVLYENLQKVRPTPRIEPNASGRLELSGFPALTENAQHIMERAASLRKLANPDAPLDARHLFGALLDTPHSTGYAALASALEGRVGLDAVQASYLDYLRDADHRSYAEFLSSRFVADPAGTPAESGVPSDAAPDWPTGAMPDRPGSQFPGYAADTLAGEDLLGVEARVQFLASVLAGKRLETPLAIGVFGDWGSGKSFFMQRLQERISMLTEHSAAADAAGQPTYYCSHIRQVTFNAWLYSGDEMWPSLAAQVFRSVNGDEPEAPHGELQRRALQAFQDQAATRLRTLTSERGHAEAEQAAVDHEIARVGAAIATKDTEILDQAERLGSGAGPVARAIAEAPAAAARASRVRRAWSVMPKRERVASIAVVVLSGAIAVATAIDSAWLGTIAAAILPLGIAITVLHRGLTYLDDTARIRGERAQLDRRLTELEAERTERASQTAAADARVQRFRARPLLPEFVAEQTERWSQQAQPGRITEIRLHFDQLSTLINDNVVARDQGAAPGADVPPIDRVVVYVDDLDRCQPPVVVKVLEAIKLLLAIPHFVVLVGVDSRWLFRSLELGFHEVLDRNRPGDPWGTTPQSYLEKIFQYSLVLPPMSSEGFGRLVKRLLPIDPDTPPPTDPPPQSGAAPPDSASTDADASPRPSGAAPAPSSSDDAADSTLVHQNGVPETVPDLTPGDLAVSQAELDFMIRLAPMFETPRAAKRLTNIYRLIRVAVGADRLLAGDGYQPMMMLLAISLAYPAQAAKLLPQLPASAETSWSKFLTREAAPIGSRAVMVGVSQAADLADRPPGDFAEWVPVVAEFSFHPWRDLVQHGAPAAR